MEGSSSSNGISRTFGQSVSPFDENLEDNEDNNSNGQISTNDPNSTDRTGNSGLEKYEVKGGWDSQDSEVFHRKNSPEGNQK